MVRHTVEAALASRAAPVLVVTGHMAAEVAAALAGLDVTLVANPDYATGLASSLKAGDRGAAGDVRRRPHRARRHAAHRERAYRSSGRRIFARCDRGADPRGQDRQSRFVAVSLFPGVAATRRRCRRQAIARHARRAREKVDLATDAIFVDVDTPEALAARAQIVRDGVSKALGGSRGGPRDIYFLFSRASRLEVSQRLPPIFCTSA